MAAGPAGTPGLGPAALLAVAVGVLVGQSTLVSLLQATGMAGGGVGAAMAIGGALMLCNSATYAELALMMPGARGIGVYVGAGLGPLPAMFAVFAGYVVPGMFGPAAELLLVDAVLQATLPGPLPPHAAAAALMLVLVALNLRGIDVFARAQTALAFTMLAALALTAAWGAAGPSAAGPVLPAGAPPAAPLPVTAVVALVMYALVGTEFVTPLTGAARNARRDVPLAMFAGLAAVLAVALAVCLTALGAVGRDTLATDPLPHRAVALAVFGPGAAPVFAWVALVATASLLNTALAAVPRMLMQMAQAGQALAVFRRTNRHGVPWVATLFVAALPAVGLAWSGGDVGRIVPLLIAASGAWLVSYMVAHAALIALRRRLPRHPRPWRCAAVPLPQVVAICGLVAVLALAAPSPELRGPIFGALAGVLCGVLALSAVWVRCVLRQPPFLPLDAPAPLERP
jgi:amino acid transporter